MTRKSHYSITDKALVDKIFSLNKSDTAKEFARTLGITEKTMSGWKSGTSRPTIDQLRRIVEVTGVSWDELLAGKKSRKATIQASLPEQKNQPTGYSLLSEFVVGLCRCDQLLATMPTPFQVKWQGFLSYQIEEMQKYQDDILAIQSQIEAGLLKESEYGSMSRYAAC